MDPIGRQFDYLCQSITNLEARMDQAVDPVAFGELKGEMRGLSTRVDRLTSDVHALSSKVDQLVDTMSEARGGWKVAATLAGLSATAGAGIGWIVQHVTFK